MSNQARLRNGAGSLLFALMLLALKAPARQPQTPSDFLVRISEMRIELSPTGVTANDCLVVQRNGRFHLERRLQQLPQTSAKISVFEFQLTKPQLRQLRDLVDQPAVSNLTQFAPLQPPYGVTDFGQFMVEIDPQSTPRQFGYFTWQGNPRPGVPPQSTPDQVQEDWRHSREALQPVLAWFHNLENQKIHSSNAAPNFCGKNIGETD